MSKVLKSLEYYLMGTFNYPIKPIPPEPDGTKFYEYEETRGMTVREPVLSDKQQELLDYEWKMYHINQAQFKELMMQKHDELKTDVCNEFGLSTDQYKDIVKIIRKRGLTATIELIYKEAILQYGQIRKLQ